MLSSAKRNRPVLALLVLTLASLAGLSLIPPIPQDQSYHQFADQRTLFGIPNVWNVVSNLPFIAVGAAGLARFHRQAATTVLFLGIFLTGFGSSYYHWNPSDGPLFWDRLPMTLCFMAILALVVEERRQIGDLRLYVWVQFFPALALPLMFLLFPPKYTGTYYWLIAAALYALAKVLEFYDGAVYSVGSILSGHTLKHLAAAGACFAILRYFMARRPIA